MSMEACSWVFERIWSLGEDADDPILNVFCQHASRMEKLPSLNSTSRYVQRTKHVFVSSTVYSAFISRLFRFKIVLLRYCIYRERFNALLIV
jgi:hypothetical protein